MAKTKVQDFTNRVESSGKVALSSNAEHIVNVIQRLLHISPGTDIYNPDMGLDVIARSRRPYTDGYRDTTYETLIGRQILEYTDIVPVNIVAVYKNQSLVLYMDVRYSDQLYRLQIGTDESDVRTMITEI